MTDKSDGRWSRLLIRAERERRKSGLLWQPQVGPQKQFVDDQETQDLVYGGARGGGKTCGLLMSFREHAARYGRDAIGILFRRSYVELKDVIRQSRDIYGEAAWRYNETDRRWTSPQGATLHLGYLDTWADTEVYQGMSVSWLGLDELGNWPTLQIPDRLWGILRSTKRGVVCVRRSTCNPGGPGHVAVRDRYHPDQPGEIRKYQPMPKEFPEFEVETKFFAARLEDNPKLLENDPDYERRLAAAGGPAVFQAWRYGRWDILAGAFFDCWNADTMTLEAAEAEALIQPWHTRWISADWGFKDPTVVHWHSIDEHGRIITYRELKLTETTPDRIAEAIVSANQGDKLDLFALAPDCFAQRTSVRTVADELGDILRAAGLPFPERADNDRVGGWSLMRQLMESGSWRISRECRELVKSIPLMQRSEKNSEDIDDSPLDHAPDAARYGLKTYMVTRHKISLEQRFARFVEDKAPGLMARMRARAASGPAPEAEPAPPREREAAPVGLINNSGSGHRRWSQEERQASSDMTQNHLLVQCEEKQRRRRFRRRAIPRWRIGG